jgi:thioredoxin reductase
MSGILIVGAGPVGLTMAAAGSAPRVVLFAADRAGADDRQGAEEYLRDRRSR